jgi:hypothetical protein
MVQPRCVTRCTRKAPPMLKTFSLAVAFFLTIGLLFAAYASVPM